MLADRIRTFLGASPLGSHPLTSEGPVEVRMARRDRMWHKAMVCMVAVLVASTTLFVAAAWAGNKPGYWYTEAFNKPQGNQQAPGQSPYSQKWTWYAQDGSKPKTIKIKLPGENAATEHANPVTVHDAAQAGNGPAATPEGWYQVYNPSIGPGALDEHKKNPNPDPDSPEGQNAMYGKPMYGNDPKFELSTTFLTNWAMKLCFNMCYAACDGMLGIADWFMGIIGANSQSMLSQDFETGAFADFYRIASKVSDYAVEPYAIAFLACVFGVAMIRASDPRRRSRGQDYMEEMLMILAMFAVCVTLIMHAIDLCALVYWLAQNLVAGVGQALEQIDMSPAGMGAGTVSEPFLAAMRQITYDQGGSVIVYLLLALVSLAVAAGCAMTVLTTIFARAGEIYLRAAASPLCLSFLVDDRARQIGMGYIKRFASVCFQAAIIFVAIAMSPLFFKVSATIIAEMGAGAISGPGGVLASILPTMVSLFAVTGIVRQSEHVANSLFGLAG